MPSTPTEVLAELRLLPQAVQEDLATIRRLAASIEKDPGGQADKNGQVRYFTGIAHKQHGLLPIGFVDYGSAASYPPPAGQAHFEFRFDSARRLASVVQHLENGDSYVTNKLIYEGDEIIARLTFGPREFQFGDYGIWRDGKLRMVGRVTADGELAFYECIIWMGEREDYTVRYAGWDRSEPDKVPLQSIDLGAVRIELKPDGTIERIWRYGYDPRGE